MAFPFKPQVPKINWNISLTKGIVGSLTFSENGGSSTFDSSGNLNTGILTGGPTWTKDLLGSSLSFDGSSTYVDMGTGSSLNPLAMSFVALVKFNALANAYTAVVSKNSGLAPNFQLFVKSNGKLACYLGAAGGVSYDGTGVFTLVTGKWYQLTMAYDKETGLKGYVNGVLDGTAAANGNLASNSGATQIGKDSVTAGRILNGLVSQVLIYNRAISRYELKQLYTDPFQVYRKPKGEL